MQPLLSDEEAKRALNAAGPMAPTAIFARASLGHLPPIALYYPRGVQDFGNVRARLQRSAEHAILTVNIMRLLEFKADDIGAAVPHLKFRLGEGPDHQDYREVKGFGVRTPAEDYEDGEEGNGESGANNAPTDEPA